MKGRERNTGEDKSNRNKSRAYPIYCNHNKDNKNKKWGKF